MDAFLAADESLFRWINDGWANPVLDAVFPFITELKYTVFPIALALLAMMVFSKRKGVVAFVLLALVIVCADQLSSFVIKPLVGRIRPCTALEHVRLLVGCGGGKSFPSSHAVNNFAAAMLLSRFYPKAAPYLFGFATLVALSRPYVGVHYPLDILGGAVLGTLVAFAVLVLFEQMKRVPFVKRLVEPRT